MGRINWVIAGAIVLAGFFAGGRYSAVAVPGDETAAPYVLMLDRFTGSAWFCVRTTCHSIPSR